MHDVSKLTFYELIIVIVNHGFGSKVLKYSKEQGIQGGTIVLGHGTHKRPLLELLELNDTRKEIVLMIAERPVVNEALDYLEEKLKLDKPNHGIAFVVPVSQFLGLGDYEDVKEVPSGGLSMTNYKAIFTIVDKGKGSEVVDSASKGGARGATIINARGSGIHETSKLFNMDIEPEKEIVLILAKEGSIEAILDHICEDLEIDLPGNGIIFVQEVHQTRGIR